MGGYGDMVEEGRLPTLRVRATSRETTNEAVGGGAHEECNERARGGSSTRSREGKEAGESTSR